jgi:pimeloyl-ACP methyl ester carboxylesterase
MSDHTLTRRSLIASGGAAAAAVLLTEPSPAPGHQRAIRRARAVDVLLVHGAWADGSSWSGVIAELQRRGFDVAAVQLLEQTLGGDTDLVAHAISRSKRPLVVAGHSYGGAVISGATAGAGNVKALVFVAAYAPDAGETLLGLNARYPAAPIGEALLFDDRGNATVDPAAFPRIFMPDVSLARARVLAAVQKPINAAALQEKAGPPGWRTIPSYYQVSTQDQVINPDLERLFARRMGAHTVELASSHASLISHSRQIAGLIERAAAETS